MQIIDDAKKIIEGISEACPKVGEKLQGLLDRASGIKNLCAETPDAKETLFEEMEAALKEAHDLCREKSMEIGLLENLLIDGQNQDCGGG